MGYLTKYTGPQIDDILSKALNMGDSVANGWIRLDSSSSNPVSLNDVLNPGNYLIYHWIYGPTLSESPITPLNMSVVTIGDLRYQFASIGGIIYSRTYDNTSQEFSPWGLDQRIGAINPGTTAPENPSENTLWLDTSNPDAPTLKIFINGTWKELTPSGAMLSAVYDTNGKKTDIFKYIDQAIKDASVESISLDFKTHIENSDIHVTSEEKTKWNSMATEEMVDNAIDGMKNDLSDDITNLVKDNTDVVDNLSTTVTELNENITNHISNTTIHPDLNKQSEWSSKADSNHTHNLDDNVKIYADKIDGTVNLDIIPYEALERIYTVDSLEALYSLTKNPVHNGDLIYIETPSSIEWYAVIDDSKLGNDDITIKNVSIGSPVNTSGGAMLQQLLYNGTTLYAFASNDMRYSYMNGQTWDEDTISYPSEDYQYLEYIDYHNGMYVGLFHTTSNRLIAYSTDGINWIAPESVGNDSYRSVKWVGSRFVVTTSTSDKVYYSTDGINWSSSSFSTAKTCIGIAYGNNKYVLTSFGDAESPKFVYSTDGVTWSETATTGLAQGNYWSIIYVGDKFITVNNSSSTLSIAYSTDGVAWTTVTDPNIQFAGCNITYVNNMYVVTGLTGSLIAYSDDLNTWHQYDIGTSFISPVSAVMGDQMIIGGRIGDIYSFNFVKEAELAFKKMSELESSLNISWSDIANTPNTIAGYGIIDAATDADIERITDELNSIKTALGLPDAEISWNDLAELTSKYNAIYNGILALESQI